MQTNNAEMENHYPVPETAPVRPGISPRKKRLETVNIGCGALMCVVIPLSIVTLGITLRAALPILLLGFAIVPLCCKLHEKTGKFRWLLALMRSIAIALLIITIIAPMICGGFGRNPSFYSVKRLVFIEGVKGSDTVQTFLPEQLPQKHDDYWFRTSGIVFAQDHRSYADLIIRTDTETLKAFEQKFSTIPDLVRAENHRYTQEELDQMTETEKETWEMTQPYQNLPEMMYTVITKHGGSQDDLSEAVVFKNSNGSGTNCGALINYQTGLLYIWV